MKKCMDCDYFKKYEGTGDGVMDGECRRHSPQSSYDNSTEQVYTWWPEVMEEDCCGEAPLGDWKEKESE
jgi:hypothetical protein